MPEAVAVPLNTNITTQPYDVGADRIDDEDELRILARRHRKHGGDPQVLLEIIQGNR